MHVGSLGMSLEQITQGARQLLDLADKINKNAGQYDEKFLLLIKLANFYDCIWQEKKIESTWFWENYHFLANQKL